MSTSTGPVATKTTGAHFDGAEDHSISRFDADEMIDAFQADNPFTTYGWYFGREAIERLLARPGAVGIRIYGGRNPDGSFSPVGVAVDSKGIPLFDTLKKTMDGGPDDGIMDRTDPCPPDC